MRHVSDTFNTPPKTPKGKWGLIIKILLTVASAIAGAFGITSCANRFF